MRELPSVDEFVALFEKYGVRPAKYVTLGLTHYNAGDPCGCPVAMLALEEGWAPARSIPQGSTEDDFTDQPFASLRYAGYNCLFLCELASGFDGLPSPYEAGTSYKLGRQIAKAVGLS